MLSSVSLALGLFDESGVVNGLGTAYPSVLVLDEPKTLHSPTFVEMSLMFKFASLHELLFSFLWFRVCIVSWV